MTLLPRQLAWIVAAPFLAAATLAASMYTAAAYAADTIIDYGGTDEDES